MVCQKTSQHSGYCVCFLHFDDQYAEAETVEVEVKDTHNISMAIMMFMITMVIIIWYDLMHRHLVFLVLHLL